MSIPREFMHFAALPHEERQAAIRRLAEQGLSVGTIASATRLSVEMVRQILGAPAREHQR